MHSASGLLLGADECLLLGIELKSTKKVKNNISAKLLIDGEVVHKLPPIEQGQPLVWNRFLFWLVLCFGQTHLGITTIICSNAGPDSTFRLNVHEESYFGLRRTPKCHYEFPASEIQNNRSNQLIGVVNSARYLLLVLM